MLSPFFFSVIILGVLSLVSQLYLVRRASCKITESEHLECCWLAVFIHSSFAAIIAACDLWPAFNTFFSFGEQILGLKVAMTFFSIVVALPMTLAVIVYWRRQHDMTSGEKIIDDWLRHPTNSP